MVYKKEFLCDSCFYADIKIEEGYRPRFKFSSEIVKIQNLSIWCKFKYSYIRKLPTFKERSKCNYRPKAGKINNKLYQQSLI